MSHSVCRKINVWSPAFSGRDGGIQQFSRLLFQSLQASPTVSSVRAVQLGSGPAGKLRFVCTAFLTLLFDRPDLVLITHLHLGRLHPLLRFLGIPYAVFCHGIECWTLEKNQDRAALRSARLVLAVSRYTLEKIRTQLPGLKAALEVFPNHVENPPAPPSRQEARKRLQLPADAKILLTVSRLSAGERYKGHREVLDCLPQLLERHPSLMYLVVGDGDDLPSLQARSKTLHLEKAVRFAGRLSNEDLECAYAASDAFVMPSTGEGFGIVFLEALIRGKPVLAGNGDGSTDPLLDGRLGLLAGPANGKDLLEKLELLVGQNPFPDYEFLKNETMAHFGLQQLQKRVDSLVSTFPLN